MTTPALNPATQPRGFVIVANPAAGAAAASLAWGVAQRLAACGAQARWEAAIAPGDIFRIARGVEADALLIAGGDGSINEAARGLLARAQPRPKLGIIPQGTVNVLARELALPRDAGALAEIFLRGRTAPLHVGLADGRPFVLMASAGIDAGVVRAIDLSLKRRLGRFAYLVAAASVLRRGDFPQVTAHTDVGTVAGPIVVVAKSRFYGGGFVIDPARSVLAPGLSLIVLTEISVGAVAALIFYLATGRVDAAGRLRRLAVTRVALRGAGVAVQIDGDFLGETPVEIRDGDETLDLLA